MSSSSMKNRERIVHISKVKDERQQNFLNERIFKQETKEINLF